MGSGPASNKINFSSIHHPPINVALKIFPLANFKGIMIHWIHMDKVMYKKILKIDDNIAYLSNLFQKSNIIRVMGKLTQTDPNRIIIDKNDRNVIENLLASYT